MTVTIQKAKVQKQQKTRTNVNFFVDLHFFVEIKGKKKTSLT